MQLGEQPTPPLPNPRDEAPRTVGSPRPAHRRSDRPPQPPRGAIEIIFRTECEARSFARDRSRDFRVLSASVTSFLIGEPGTRHPVAWYVDGEEQSRKFDRLLYPTDGST